MKRWQRIVLSILAVLLLLILVGPFLVPVPEQPGLQTERELAEPDSQFIQVGDVTVHYKEAGQGADTFILLHGFGASVFSWREVLDDFAAYGRVIAYDRPAFGLTSRPMPGEWSGESPYSTDANVELLSGLMDALDIERATLVGNSAGGTVAAAFALKYPQRVERLILVSPAVGGTGGGRFPQWALPLLASPQLRHVGPLLVRDIAQTGNATILQAWHDPSRVTDEIIAGYRKPLQVFNWDRALYEFTIAPRPAGLNEHLGELTMPVSLITGDDDRIVPTANTVALADTISGAQLNVLPDCGHVPQEECPGPFMQVVETFLEFGLK